MFRNYGYDQELEGKSYPPGLKNDSLETDAGRIGFPSDALGRVSPSESVSFLPGLPDGRGS